jgi:hypothetical protein
MQKYTIEKLFESKIISIRTFNVCFHSRLTSLFEILEYYKKYNSFLTLRNCGSKVNDELIYLCCNYKKLINKNIEEPDNAAIRKAHAIESYINSVMKNEIPALTNAQKNIINFQILVWAKLLSKRAYNALFYLLNGNFSIDNICEIILSNIYFNFSKVRNVGRATLPELNKFINNIKTYISILSIISNDRKDFAGNEKNDIENVTIKIYEAFLYNEFKISDENLEEIRNIYNQTGNVPIFKILDILINGGYLFNNSELLIFNHLLGYRDEKPLSAMQLTTMIKISKEKINQFKNRILRDFEDLFRFITIFDFSDLYGINLKDDIISLSKSDIDRINKLEKVNFSKQFYIKILLLFTKSTHTLIECPEPFTGYYNLKYFEENKEQYLIALNVTSVFNFNELIYDLYKLTPGKRRKTILNLNSIFNRYFYTKDYSDFNNILKICNKIVKK